jgi:hypothetical protein
VTCSIPICVLIERTMPDGSETLLMAPDLPTALSDAVLAQASGAWTARRMVLGRDAVLQDDALAEAIATASRPA